MLERSNIKDHIVLRKLCIENIVQAYRSLKTDRIAIKFNIYANEWIQELVVIFSSEWYLITVLTEKMFTLKTRVNHQYKLYKLLESDYFFIRKND